MDHDGTRHFGNRAENVERADATLAGSRDGDAVATYSGRDGRASDFDGVLAAAEARRVPFAFNLDDACGQQISGWIQQCDRPSRRCVVTLKEGGRVLARATASRFRAELTWMGVGDGCHSFVMPIPPDLRDGQEHVLGVFEEDSGFPLAPEPIRWRSPAPIAARNGAACSDASRLPWQAPHPYAEIPYSREIAFGRLDRTIDGAGVLPPTHAANARRGLIRRDRLTDQAFAWGEEVRTGRHWAHPEDWGTWSCHSGGEIAMALPASDSSAYYAILRLRVSGPLVDRPIRIAANGEPVWEGIVGPQSRNIVVRVRRNVATHGFGWELRLRAQADLSAELHSRIAAVDDRVPTIGFERLIVVPDDDLKTSLDIIYTLLL